MNTAAPEGWIDPLSAFLEKTHFFWGLETLFSTENIFLCFSIWAVLSLLYMFPIIWKRTPNLHELSTSARRFFLWFARILIVKAIIKMSLFPLYPDQIALSTDECMILLFGALLLFDALREPTMNELLRGFYSDRHFSNGKFGVFFVKNDDPQNPVILDDPTDTPTSTDTHSSTPPKAKGALQAP